MTGQGRQRIGAPKATILLCPRRALTCISLWLNPDAIRHCKLSAERSAAAFRWPLPRWPSPTPPEARRDLELQVTWQISERATEGGPLSTLPGAAHQVEPLRNAGGNSSCSQVW